VTKALRRFGLDTLSLHQRNLTDKCARICGTNNGRTGDYLFHLAQNKAMTSGSMHNSSIERVCKLCDISVMGKDGRRGGESDPRIDPTHTAAANVYLGDEVRSLVMVKKQVGRCFS